MLPKNLFLVESSRRNIFLSDFIGDAFNRQLKILNNYDIISLGDFSDYTTENNTIKVKGISKEKAQEFFDELVKKENKERKYITVSTIKGRGWTDGLINKYLGEPDLVLTNPHYKSSPPMRLYALAHVEFIEKKDDFKEYIERKSASRKKLSASLKIIADEKRKKLINYVNSLDINIYDFKSEQSLIEAAVNHYNCLWLDRGRDDKYATISDDRKFLHRIAVNMLRHDSEQYEPVIYELFGQVGKNEAYHVLRDAVLSKIAKKYPYLEEECNNQR